MRCAARNCISLRLGAGPTSSPELSSRHFNYTTLTERADSGAHPAYPCELVQIGLAGTVLLAALGVGTGNPTLTSPTCSVV